MLSSFILVVFGLSSLQFRHFSQFGRYVFICCPCTAQNGRKETPDRIGKIPPEGCPLSINTIENQRRQRREEDHDAADKCHDK